MAGTTKVFLLGLYGTPSLSELRRYHTAALYKVAYNRFVDKTLWYADSKLVFTLAHKKLLKGHLNMGKREGGEKKAGFSINRD
jgi:hypothetical protein